MVSSKMRKTRAFSDGRLSVGGGPDLRDEHVGRFREAYDAGAAEMREEQEREVEYRENPLRLLQTRLQPIMQSEDSDVAELADILDDLLLRMLNLEEGLG